MTPSSMMRNIINVTCDTKSTVDQNLQMVSGVVGDMLSHGPTVTFRSR